MADIRDTERWTEIRAFMYGKGFRYCHSALIYVQGSPRSQLAYAWGLEEMGEVSGEGIVNVTMFLSDAEKTPSPSDSHTFFMLNPNSIPN